MPRARLSVAEKKLRGTYERSRDEPRTAGRMRLTAPIDPPAGMDRAARGEWAVHMSLAVSAGTLSHTDLRGFQALVEAATLTARAYRAAMRVGPIARGDRGSKVSPEWQAWGAAVSKYTALLDRFGLTPASGRLLPQLPVPGGKPREVA